MIQDHIHTWGLASSREFDILNGNQIYIDSHIVICRFSNNVKYVKVQIVCKTLWTFRPPNYKLPIQAYNQTMYVRNINISLKLNR